MKTMIMVLFCGLIGGCSQLTPSVALVHAGSEGKNGTNYTVNGVTNSPENFVAEASGARVREELADAQADMIRRMPCAALPYMFGGMGHIHPNDNYWTTATLAAATQQPCGSTRRVVARKRSDKKEVEQIVDQKLAPVKAQADRAEDKADDAVCMHLWKVGRTSPTCERKKNGGAK